MQNYSISIDQASYQIFCDDDRILVWGINIGVAIKTDNVVTNRISKWISVNFRKEDMYISILLIINILDNEQYIYEGIGRFV